MVRTALFGLVATILVPALAVQVPLESRHRWQDKHPGILAGGDHTEWNLDKSPNPNDTHHLVFETVHSLLQLWPNTRMRPGHNIVPGIIPKGTLLYHGTTRKESPSGPDWVAIDPEFSNFFCRKVWAPAGDPPQECWHLTLATTRPLKIVYFDGSSAAKFPDGSLDAQNLMIWGESLTLPDYASEELERIEDLCEWVKKFGVDGIVRMCTDFEVMLCDFTSGVREISFVNLEPPRINLPDFSGLATFEAVNAGSWHNRFPGETRIQLDLTRLVSFYDAQLAPSLVAARAGRERWDHRLQSISNDDLSAVRSKVEAVLARPWGSSSGIDWKTLVQVIVDRFAQRLELIRHLLNSPATSPDELPDLANKTQTQLRIMLTPYLLLSATPTEPSGKTDLDWSIPIYKLCATTHTHPMESELDSMTDSEKLLLQAVRGTSREICRVVTRMWVAGVYAGIDASLNTKVSLDIAEVIQVWNKWAEDLNGLVAWLDWSVWVKCDPHCGPEEICYLPQWPFGFPSFPRRGSGGGRKPSPVPEPDRTHSERPTSFDLRAMAAERLTEEVWGTVEPKSDEWIRPQPKCIKRADPYRL